jgi:hypothetical protein
MDVDNLQDNVMQVLKDCNYEPTEVMNVMLSIAVSIASEINPENPIGLITERTTAIKLWHENEDKKNL